MLRGQVIGLWVLFALPVWSAAYKQAGGQNPEWLGASHVREDIAGLGLVAKAAPEWDGPTFGKPHLTSVLGLVVLTANSFR